MDGLGQKWTRKDIFNQFKTRRDNLFDDCRRELDIFAFLIMSKHAFHLKMD